MRIGRYKLAKVGDGRCHFGMAEVALLQEPAGETTPSDRFRLINPSSYLPGTTEACNAGAELALRKFGDIETDVIEFQQIVEVPIDSNPHAFWCASFIATSNALGVPSLVSQFNSETLRWDVRLPSGHVIHQTDE